MTTDLKLHENLSLRHEIDRLLETDMDWKGVGEADIVLDDLETALADYPFLFNDIAERAVNFAQENASPMLSARLEVTDKPPAEAEHNPNTIILYEKEGVVEDDYLQRSQHLTISGTKSAVSRVSDLDKFMGPNKKIRGILYMGTFRVDDLTALDTDFSALIDTMAAMGVPDDVIEEMVALLISGDAPEALVQAAEAIIALGQMPDATPEAIAPILQQLESALVDAVPQAKSERVAAIVARIADGLQPVVKAQPAAIAPKVQAFQRGEAPKLSERLSALKVITNVVQTTAALLKEPTLPAADKAKLVETLASVRTNILNPQSTAFTQAFVKLATQIIPLAEKFPLPIQTAGVEAAKPTPLAQRIADVTQAIAKAAIVVLPPAMRESLNLPARLAEKPSNLLQAKLPETAIQGLMGLIAKTAVTVTGKTVPAVKFVQPAMAIRTVARMEAAAPAAQAARFAATKADNDNKTATPAMRNTVRALAAGIGEMVARVRPSMPSVTRGVASRSATTAAPVAAAAAPLRAAPPPAVKDATPAKVAVSVAPKTNVAPVTPAIPTGAPPPVVDKTSTEATPASPVGKGTIIADIGPANPASPGEATEPVKNAEPIVTETPPPVTAPEKGNETTLPIPPQNDPGAAPIILAVAGGEGGADPSSSPVTDALPVKDPTSEPEVGLKTAEPEGPAQEAGDGPTSNPDGDVKDKTVEPSQDKAPEQGGPDGCPHGGGPCQCGPDFEKAVKDGLDAKNAEAKLEDIVVGGPDGIERIITVKEQQWAQAETDKIMQKEAERGGVPSSTPTQNDYAIALQNLRDKISNQPNPLWDDKDKIRRMVEKFNEHVCGPNCPEHAPKTAPTNSKSGPAPARN